MRTRVLMLLVLHREVIFASTYCQEQVVDGELEYLVLASDGLWDVVTNEVRYIISHRLL